MTREEAIKKIKKSWDFLGNDEKEILETLIPELQESEDEKIRKWIIDDIRYNMNNEPLNNSEYKKKAEKAIAWLEKQGEQKPAKNIVEIWKDMRLEVYQQASGNRHEANYSDDTTKMFSLNDIDEIFEKISEQKLADKDESIFNVGDWVTNGSDCTFQIASIKNGMYYDINNCGSDIENTDKYYYLWTIQDAKEGDVLATDKSVFIYAKVLYSKPYAYCGVDKFGVFKDNCLKNNWANSVDNIHPATKEQRDTLFAAMKAEGYEWDAEKKIVKKRKVVTENLI